MLVLCSSRSRSCEDTSFVRKALSSTDNRVMEDLMKERSRSQNTSKETQFYEVNTVKHKIVNKKINY
jgi:hypothetical protein